MYPEDLIQKIIDQADISAVISSYIPVISKGRNYVSICPFHDDSRPSMQISKEKRIFKCFACGEGGNVISFVSKYEKIGFDKAAKKVADMVGVVDERLTSMERKEPTVDPNLKPFYDCIDDLEKYYQYGLSIQEGEEAMNYLKGRNISQEAIQKYGIGYAPSDGHKTIKFLEAKGHSLRSIQQIGITQLRNAEHAADSNAGRVIFPLKDPNGRVVGFSARRIKQDDSAKYINSPETPIFHKGSVLYNYSEAKLTAHRDGYVYLLEGFMDVMALNSIGINSAVALMGTALTEEHARLLRRLGVKEIRVCLDGDKAGQMGMMKVAEVLNKAGLSFRLVEYGDDLRDPDDILQESGGEFLKERMNKLISFFDFRLNYYLNIKKLETIEDKKAVLKYFLKVLATYPDGEERDNYIHKLSKATDFQVSYIREKLRLLSSAEEEIEETAYVKDIDFSKRRPDKFIKRRLRTAEREMLYYMLHSVDAVKYYETKIDNFSYPTYKEIANYIVDYVYEHNESVDIASLISNIESKHSENSKQLIDELTEVSNDDNHPPLREESGDELFERCALAIMDEKAKISEERQAEKLNGKSVEEQAALAAQLAQQKRDRLKGKKKK